MIRRGTILWIFVLAAALGIAWPGAAGAQRAERAGASPSRASVERLLAGYEPTSRPEDLRKLGPGVDRVLVEIATDARAARLRRARALHALGFVPSQLGLELLRAVLRERAASDDAGDALDAGACARALGHFGDTAVGDLVPLLSHPAPEVRIAAADGLERTGTPTARTAIEQRLFVERDAGAHAALRASLARLVAR